MTENNREHTCPGVCGICTIELRGGLELFSKMRLLFQTGLLLNLSAETDLKSLLMRELGISEEFLSSRIQTIFLDGKPLDNPETAMINPGSVIALSAAMPGVAGASLRVKGDYAALREGITHKDLQVSRRGRGYVTVKLFNLLIDQLGLMLLGRGMFVLASSLASYFSTRPSSFWTECAELRINGQAVPPVQFPFDCLLIEKGVVFLKVEFTDKETGHIPGLE